MQHLVWSCGGDSFTGSTMASNDPSVASSKDEEQENIANRVANLPLVSSAYDMVSTAYTSTKESYPYVKSVCDVAEKGMKTMAAAAVSGAQPILSKLEPQISSANEYACRGLDKLEEKLPILQQPTDKIISNTKDLVTATVTGAKDAMSNTMTGMVDMTKGAVQGSVELTRSAVTSGVNTVMGSAVGQMVVSGMGAVLGKSEELVDHYLPMTDEELAKLATSVEGFEMASVEQQKQQQSYFVRLGSLSSKLRHRAYQHSLGKLRHARQSTQEALSQLHQTIELIEHAKQGVDQKLRDGQEKLHQMWLEWSQKQPSLSKEVGSVQPEVEEQALVMSRSLTQQLQTTCLTLVSSLQGLPADLQDKAQLVRHHVDELRASFSAAGSFHDLTGSVLAQSRERVTKARKLVDELMDHVVHNVPLSWLVGPFAPSGKQQEEVEMEQCPAD
ncbi:perilipin-3-like isoform X2 [Mauremys reevesii]|uniref:perilipin-3-like isoform X2 n=1 Tax=Mauremys reevesii TaxID=260615 RepID=UPI00193F9B4F|nr:perilipin-3-like isoform X2 [Mauremys reevesii]